MSERVQRRGGDEMAPLRELEQQWAEGFARIGMRHSFGHDCFVSWDGRGTVLLSERAEFDPDDTLAQILLHEFCHWLTEGHDAYSSFDWGLSNVDDRHLANEHASLRVQAQLNDQHGLRAWLYPTTDHFFAYQRLADAPLTDPMEAELDARSRKLADKAIASLNSWAEWPVVSDLLHRTSSALRLAVPR